MTQEDERLSMLSRIGADTLASRSPAQPLTEREAIAGRSRPIEAARRVLLGLILAGTVALPLMFAIAFRDVFALPKTAAMVALTVPMVLACAVVELMPTPWRRSVASRVVDLLLVYLALTVIATLRSTFPPHSLFGEPLQYQGLVASLCYAVAFLAARAGVSSERRAWLLVGSTLAAASIVAAYGLLQEAGLDPIWHVLDRGRIFSTLGQANALAAYLVLAIPLGLAALVASRRRLRLVAGLIVLALLAALALTLSRGGFLGAAAAVGVFVALAVRPRRRLRRPPMRTAAAVVATSLLVAAAIYLVPPMTRTIDRVVDRVAQIVPWESSATSHLDLWAVGVGIAVDHPLLGVGPEVFPFYVPEYRDKVLSPERAAVMSRFRPESPHDVPIAIADGAGIPALILYLAFIATVLWLGLRAAIRADGRRRILIAGIIAALAGHFVTDLFMTAETSGSWLFWVLLGVVLAAASEWAGNEAVQSP